MSVSAARAVSDLMYEGVTLPDLARRLAGELEAAAAIADDCQDAFSDVLECGMNESLGARMQALDLLSQRLADVSALLHRLGDLRGVGAVPLRMFDGMRLSDVSRRLTGGDPYEIAEREAEFW
jgi:hypothetical protein